MHSPSPAQASDDTHPTPTRKSPSWHSSLLIFPVLAPVAIALLIYRLDTLDPAPLPLHELTQPVAAAPKRNAHMLKGSEFVGAGALVAPEDVAYDPKTGLIYTGCADGWVKRVTLNESAADSVVENWVFTGGRPLGLAHGADKEVYVADTEKVSLILIHGRRSYPDPFHQINQIKGSGSLKFDSTVINRDHFTSYNNFTV